MGKETRSELPQDHSLRFGDQIRSKRLGEETQIFAPPQWGQPPIRVRSPDPASGWGRLCLDQQVADQICICDDQSLPALLARSRKSGSSDSRGLIRSASISSIVGVLRGSTSARSSNTSASRLRLRRFAAACALSFLCISSGTSRIRTAGIVATFLIVSTMIAECYNKEGLCE